MAFVYKNQNYDPFQEKVPGPGNYEVNATSSKPRLYSAPFNNSSVRKVWSQNQNPGVGTYQVSKKICEQHKIVQNLSQNITIFQPLKQTFSFKSVSKRFQNVKDHNPGPGQYQFTVANTQKKILKVRQNKLKMYLQQANKAKKIQITQPEDIFFDQKMQRLKQKQYNNNKHSQKINIPFNTKVQRCQKERPQTSIGPGSYNLQKQNKNSDKIKLRSNTKSIQKRLVSNKEQCFIGPCTYFNQQNQQATKVNKKIKKDDYFGSKVQRFKIKNLTENLNPGPGAYQLRTEESVCKLQSHNAFGSTLNHSIFRNVQQNKATKFTMGQNQQRIKIQKNNSKDKPKIQCFGFKQKRFKDITNQIQKNQQNIEMNQKYFKPCFKIQNQMEKTKTLKKKQVKIQRIVPNNMNQRPLCYDWNHYTIANKIKSKTQIKAPFMSGQARFYEGYTENLIKQILQNNNGKSILKQNKSQQPKQIIGGSSMKSKSPRFKYKQPSNEISPHTYNPTLQNKKQFNKLFL